MPGSSLECGSEAQEKALVWRCHSGFIGFRMVIKAKRAGGHAQEMNQSSGSQLGAVLFPRGTFIWGHLWLL